MFGREKSLTLQQAAHWCHAAVESVRCWMVADEIYAMSQWGVGSPQQIEAEDRREGAASDIDTAWMNLLGIARDGELTPGYVHRPAVLCFEAALLIEDAMGDEAIKRLDEAEKILMQFAAELGRAAANG